MAERYAYDIFFVSKKPRAQKRKYLPLYEARNGIFYRHVDHYAITACVQWEAVILAGLQWEIITTISTNHSPSLSVDAWKSLQPGCLQGNTPFP